MEQQARSFPAHRLFKTLAAAALLLGLLEMLNAHVNALRLVNQLLTIEIADRYVDVTVEVRYPQVTAREERQKMDQNADGRISRQEVSSYLLQLSRTILEDLNLWIDGDPVELELWLGPFHDPPAIDRGDASLRYVFHYAAHFDVGKPGLRRFHLLNRCFRKNPGSLQFAIRQAGGIRLRKISIDEGAPFRVLVNQRQLVGWFEADRSAKEQSRSVVSPFIILAPEPELSESHEHP